MSAIPLADSCDFIVRRYEEGDEPAVVALWREALPDGAPHNAPATIIQKKLAIERDLFFLAEIEQVIMGAVIGGYDGHPGWIYSLAVDPTRRREGIGRALVTRGEAALRERGCLKVNLQVRASNAAVVEFYRKLGYLFEERISMGKRLYLI